MGSELVVEWRALTIILIDMVAKRMREKLKKDEKELPLARVLQGTSCLLAFRALLLSVAHDGVFCVVCRRHLASRPSVGRGFQTPRARASDRRASRRQRLLSSQTRLDNDSIDDLNLFAYDV